MHDFAFIFTLKFYGQATVSARFELVHATALKPTHEAGRRGGDSIARGGVCTI